MNIQSEPNIGDIRIHLVPCGAKIKQIYSACVGCEKRRWVPLKFGKPAYSCCYVCGAKKRN